MTALVVLSGGQDSTTCLFKACREHDIVHALTIDYNQRHTREIEAARTVAQMAGIASHEVLAVGPVLKGKSFLTDPQAPIETFHSYDDMDRANVQKEDKLDSSFVPMRNALFMVLAANRAYVLGCDTIITGITAADFAEFGGLSWEWLGGFTDAEGYVGIDNYGVGFRLGISQKDPELLYRVKAWLGENAPDGFTCSVNVQPRSQMAQLTIGKRSVALIADKLTPHLHSPYRRAQCAAVELPLAEEASLSDAYVTGFWEGDGSCYAIQAGERRQTPTFTFNFHQKDPEVLEEIKQYLGTGMLYQHSPRKWELRVNDNPRSSSFLRRLRKHLNALGSFKKITHHRHALELPAGGFNPPYPDCSPDWLRALQVLVDESLLSPFIEGVKIKAPLLFLTKAQSVHLAISIPGAMEALAYSHTCYAGQFPPCGECHACLLRAKGFEQAGAEDPLITRAYAA